MIKKLKNSDIEIAKNIRTVFQLSYKVEAELLNATDFPPLKRTLTNFINSETDFFGYLKDGELTGVIEIENNSSFTDIHSLVVHPNFFRQGIAHNLMKFIVNKFNSNLFIVETGFENEPAKNLYKKFGFKEIKQWHTEQGIKKVKLELRINN